MMFLCHSKREIPSVLKRDIKEIVVKITQDLRVVFLDMDIIICSAQTTHFAQNEVMSWSIGWSWRNILEE